jgi:hypothetical protein
MSIIDVDATEAVQQPEQVNSETEALIKIAKIEPAGGRRDEKGRILPGQVLNPMGGPIARRVQEFQKLLNKEHRNLEATRELFQRLRALAMGETTLVPVVTRDGTVKVEARIKADAAFMKLYLDRVWGTAKPFEAGMDLTDAPQSVIDYLTEKLRK